MKIVSEHTTATAIEQWGELQEWCAMLQVCTTNERDEETVESIYDQCGESIEFYTKEPHLISVTDPDWRIRIEKWRGDLKKVETRAKRKRKW